MQSAPLRRNPQPKKPRNQQPKKPIAVPGADDKLDAVIENFDSLFGFYQSQTSNAARWFIVLQVVTLVGTALTPIMLLLPLAERGIYTRLFQALPAAFGGLAAALN